MPASELLFKISITGPESTGKSALCEALAKHFNTVFVPEYAREYLQNLNRPYTSDDLVEIALEQLNLQNQKRDLAKGVLFLDTDFTVLKIWHENAFGEMPDIIDLLYEMQDYDLYLLCDIDLPWEPDPLREHPNQREYFFNLYKEDLEDRDVDYGIVSGSGEARLKNALKIIEEKLGI